MKNLILLLLLVTQIIVAQDDNNRGYKVKVGEQAPAFEFQLLDGSTINNEILKNKVVVLQFTASWCGVCRKEMPHLEKQVWQRFKN
ncbi:MAG TPA: TlpA disulfide reductase family protein, partial [Flavobacteriaceae bacterium]|nr:TlpA disulfide reductase family protein [Flavobacteriaceae bacterium]